MDAFISLLPTDKQAEAREAAAVARNIFSKANVGAAPILPRIADFSGRDFWILRTTFFNTQVLRF
jgi:hypothetical protein